MSTNVKAKKIKKYFNDLKGILTIVAYNWFLFPWAKTTNILHYLHAPIMVCLSILEHYLCVRVCVCVSLSLSLSLSLLMRLSVYP